MLYLGENPKLYIVVCRAVRTLLLATQLTPSFNECSQDAYILRSPSIPQTFSRQAIDLLELRSQAKINGNEIVLNKRKRRIKW